MKRVAYFCEEFSQYRFGIISKVAKSHDVTVFCERFASSNFTDENVKVELVEIAKRGPFLKFCLPEFYKLCSKFDVVIGLSNLRFYQLMLLCIRPRNFKLALWGIGVTGSYTKKFGSWSFATLIRGLITRFADGLIFYSDAPIAFYRKLGYPNSNMYVAHNTVENLVDVDFSSPRNSIIFVGTLYKAKGLEELIIQYRDALGTEHEKFPKLFIIGGGELYISLKTFISRLGLSDYIVLTGPVYDKALLKRYFDNAIFCVSPKQAGLSVLTSMSFGVPFVTSHDAITGGEILNIKNGINGLILDNISQLKDVIEQASASPSVFSLMGKNAYDHYRQNRHPDVMVRALIECIDDL